MVKTVGKYDLYGTLGEGAFGKVKYAVNTETNEAVAIKILDKDKIQARNMGAQIKKEISIMKMINHHHVVAVKDVFATSAKIFIVLEFVGGGELFDKIANEGKLPEDKARFYFKQLVEGLEHCHNNGICHRDLKPENLLLDTDGNLKISDFGFSTLNIGDADGDGTQRAELLHTTCGTPNYVAPEVLGKDGYDGKKADVWSCGVILYVLLAGYLPFDENTMAALFQKIKNADYEFPEWFTPDARDLIKKILVPDPVKRPRLAELKLHPWMQKSDSGPTPIIPIDHAAQMGAPRTVNTVHTTPVPPPANNNGGHSNHPPAAPAATHSHKEKENHHHHHQQRDNHNHTAPKQESKTNQHQHQAPPALAVDKINDQFSADKAAEMSTPTNAAAQSSARNSGKHANGHAAPAPVVQESPKETPKPQEAPEPAPAPVPAQEPKKAVTVTPPAPTPAQQPPAAAPAPKSTPTTQQPSNKPAPPANQTRSTTTEVDTGLFCCSARKQPGK